MTVGAPKLLWHWSISIDGIIIAINSRGSLSYANYNSVWNKMNFSFPLFYCCLSWNAVFLTHFQNTEAFPVTFGNHYVSFLFTTNQAIKVVSLMHCSKKKKFIIKEVYSKAGSKTQVQRMNLRMYKGFFHGFKPKTKLRLVSVEN